MQPPWTASPEFSARRQRRRRLRNIFLGLALAVVAVGLVFLILGFAPGLLGVRPGALGWRSAGGFLGLFLVFWGAVLLLRIAFWSHRWAAGGPGGGPGPHRFDPAIVTARQRYARGEITREQFQQIVSDLRRPPGPPLA